MHTVSSGVIGPASVTRASSPLGGFGVFATRKIPRFTRVIAKWHEEFCRNLDGWISLTAHQVQHLPGERKKLFLQYGLDQDFNWIIGPSDPEWVTTFDNFINHSCQPNLGYDELGNVVALRDIEGAGELLIDYGFFSINFDEPFQCLCGARDCRGRVTREDWKLLAPRYGLNLPRFLHEAVRKARHSGDSGRNGALQNR